MTGGNPAQPREVKIRVHDGVEIAVALYMPAGEGPFPVLLAPSPYRYDNNSLPATPQFLWRETGPIDFYLAHGYVYANMDVRGCGKSGGEFRLLDSNEQKDLYDVIEWLGHQPWSNGKVGGIGQSYFCMSQWWMAIQKPPSLACIAAFDGLNDPYRASVYQGGMLGDFFGSYWWNQNRIINRHPGQRRKRRASRPAISTCSSSSTRPTTISGASAAPPSGCTRSRCRSIRSASGARSISTPAAISTAIRRAKRAEEAADERPDQRLRRQRASSTAPRCTRNCCCRSTTISSRARRPTMRQRPAVEYFVRGADAIRTAETWPPPGVRYLDWHLGAEKTGSVTSLNDGSLTREAAAGAAETSYAYPNPGWMLGVIGFGPNNAARSGAPRPDLHDRAAGRRIWRSPGRSSWCCYAVLDRDRHGFLRQAVGADAAIAGGPRQGAQPGLVLDHQGLAARLAPRARSEQEHRDGALSHPHRSAADRARRDLPLRHQHRADGASLQGGQSRSGWRSSTATPRSPTCCGRIITRRTRSAPTRSIIRPSTRRR